MKRSITLLDETAINTGNAKVMPDDAVNVDSSAHRRGLFHFHGILQAYHVRML